MAKAATLATGGLAGSSSGFAQEAAFPSRTVKLIVPFPPGGVVDFIARTIAPKLSALWGQAVVIDNRSGAAGNPAAIALLQAPADGYTLLLGHVGMAINPFLFSNMAYDMRKSFAAISSITFGSAILYVNASLPVKDFKELVSYAKSRPGELTFASSGVGTVPHLTGALLQQETGMQLTHIPYRGAAAAVNDIVAGAVHMGFDYAVPSGEFVHAGKLRALFVAGPRRIPLLPNVPTAAEVGLPGFDSTAWTGMFAHAATPAAILQKISRDLTKILATDEEQARGLKLGIDFRGSTPEAMRAVMERDIVQWGDIIKRTDIKLLE